ncbi:MAG: DUF2029 domain-containing protein [Anaerolineaceae bacterium]|nr:DUF2029 domain-containing protein [Anaerolineaceae bacterium]MBN2677485.1 DUF2029 domain-containing protein [Anaerolineaceae bacterium]
MKTLSFGITRLVLLIMGIITTLVFGTFALKGVSQLPVPRDEFPINYIAAKNWISDNRSPYDLRNSEEVGSITLDRGYSESGELVVDFQNLPLTIIVFLPFTFLPIEYAEALWRTVNILCLIVGGILLTLLLSHQKVSFSIMSATAGFCSLNYYSVLCLLTNNVIPILFLLMSISLYLIIQNKDSLAGFLSSLIWVNLQLGSFFILFLIIWAKQHQKIKYIRSLLAATLFEMVIVFIIFPGWIAGYLKNLLNVVSTNGRFASVISQSINCQFTQEKVFLLIIHLALILLLVIVWFNYRYRDEKFLLWLSAITILITSLITFPVKEGHQVFCIPAIIITLYTWLYRWKEYGSRFFWFVSVILFAFPWILAMVNGESINSFILVFLYAIVGIIGLWWIRWWMIRPEY